MGVSGGIHPKTSNISSVWYDILVFTWSFSEGVLGPLWRSGGHLISH